MAMGQAAQNSKTLSRLPESHRLDNACFTGGRGQRDSTSFPACPWHERRLQCHRLLDNQEDLIKPLNIQQRTPYILILSLLVAGCFSIAPAAKLQTLSSGSSEEIRQLLSQVETKKAMALELEELAAWTGVQQLQYRSHARKLSSIKDHIDQAASSLPTLTKPKGSLALAA